MRSHGNADTLWYGTVWYGMQYATVHVSSSHRTMVYPTLQEENDLVVI